MEAITTLDDLVPGDRVTWDTRAGRSDPKEVVAMHIRNGHTIWVAVSGEDGVVTTLEVTPPGLQRLGKYDTR